MLIISSYTQRYKKQNKPVPTAIRVIFVVLGIALIALGVFVIATTFKH
jgi:hypothetical protein